MGLAPCCSDLLPTWLALWAFGKTGLITASLISSPEAQRKASVNLPLPDSHSPHYCKSLQKQGELISSICATSQHRGYFYYMAPTVFLGISSEVYESPGRVARCARGHPEGIASRGHCNILTLKPRSWRDLAVVVPVLQLAPPRGLQTPGWVEGKC